MRISNIIAGWAILIAPVALAAPVQQQYQDTAISAKEPIQPRHIPETASGTPASPGLARRATFSISIEEDIQGHEYPRQDLPLEVLQALPEPIKQGFCPCKFGKPDRERKDKLLIHSHFAGAHEKFESVWKSFCPCMNTSHLNITWDNMNEAASSGLARRATLSIGEHNQPGNTAEPIQPRQNEVKVEGTSFSKMMEFLCPCQYGAVKSAMPASLTLNPNYPKYAEFSQKFKEEFEKDCPCMSFKDIKINLQNDNPGLARRATFSIGSIEEAI